MDEIAVQYRCGPELRQIHGSAKLYTADTAPGMLEMMS
jgi:hypothetical protein